MTRSTSASAWTALLALTVGSGCSGSEADTAGATGNPGSGGAGNGGAGSSSGKGSGAIASSSVVVSSAAATGTGGGRPFVCDPPAAPGSIYEATADSFAFVEPISMCKYRGDVMLAVNTAAL